MHRHFSLCVVLAAAISIMVACRGAEPEGGSSDSKKESGSGTGSGTGAGTALTYHKDAKSILDRACAPCHGSRPKGGAPGDFVLSSYEDVGAQIGVHGKLTAVRASLANKTMPVGGYEIADDEKQKILDWIDGGAPEGTIPEAEAPGGPSSLEAAVTPNESVSGGNTPGTAPGSSNAPLPGASSSSKALQLALTSPSTAGETADSSYFVQVQATNAPKGATWSLFYSSEKGATTGGTSLAKDQPATAKSYTWDTSSVAAGDYYLYVVMSGAGKVLATSGAVGSISIAHSGNANHAPIVTLSAPNGGAVYTLGQTVEVRFSATDPDGDALTYKVSLCNDGGQIWTPLATDLKTGPFQWTIGQDVAPGAGFRIRITADDGAGGITNVSSSATFAIGSGTVTYHANVKSMLSNYCGPCHTSGTGRNRGLYVWDTYAGSSAAAFPKRNNANSRIQSDTMPPGGGVSQADKDMMQAWISSGAAE